MLSLSLPGRVFLCTLPTDMRKSFDSLAGLGGRRLRPFSNLGLKWMAIGDSLIPQLGIREAH